MISKYFFILGVCILLTLPLEIVFKARVYARFLTALKAISIPAGFYLIWDYFATRAEHWTFSEEATYSFRLLGLPIEEILFFIIVPLCALLTFETIKNIDLRSLTLKTPLKFWIFYIIGFAGSGLMIYYLRLTEFQLNIPERNFPFYTLATGIFVLIFIFLMRKNPIFIDLVKRRAYFYTILICLFFMIFINGYLTILDNPVVAYKANLGPRLFFDIPFEDFFYGTALLTWVLFRWVRYTGSLDMQSGKKIEK